MSTDTIPVRRSGGLLKTLDEIGIFVWRNLAHIPRVPERLLDVTIQPIMFVLLFGYVFGSAISVPGGNYREFLMAGIFIQTLSFAAMSTAVGVVNDFAEAVIDRASADGHLAAEIIRIHPRRVLAYNVDPEQPGLQSRSVAAGDSQPNVA